MGYFESFIGVNFWTALFVLLNTLIIFFVAKKYLVVPVHKMITERQKEIDDMYDHADKARADAQEMKAEYQQKRQQKAKGDHPAQGLLSHCIPSPRGQPTGWAVLFK